jgi:predicted nucleic acid-binding protein
MPLNYNVQAQVVDIKSDKPKKEDKFLIDTNALFWYSSTISHFSSFPDSFKPKHYQITKYPTYIHQAILAGSSLLYCGLSMAELAHLIEKTNKELFSSALPAKEYRHNYPAERAFVVSEIQDSWSEVEAIAESIEILVNRDTTKNVLAKFHNRFVDGYDSFIIEAMLNAGIDQIITDDGDYVTVPGIKVFTANYTTIQAAKSQGMLLSR